MKIRKPDIADHHAATPSSEALRNIARGVPDPAPITFAIKSLTEGSRYSIICPLLGEAGRQDCDGESPQQAKTLQAPTSGSA